MAQLTTEELVHRFNDAFVVHDPSGLDDLIGDDCVMEAIQPAPDGARYEGREASLAFWKALAEDRGSQFEAEEIVVTGDRATIRWRYHFGDGLAESVRGVNLMRVRDGKIVEALGYSKTGGEVPLAAETSAGHVRESESDLSGRSGDVAVQPILSTNDIGRLSSFYTKLFGAEEELRVPGRKGPFFVTLRFGGASLCLVDHQQGAKAAPGQVAVAVFVPDVADLLPGVEPAGGKGLRAAKDMPWGHRVAHIVDPDGNKVNLTQRL